jgi:hypothetical protein
MAHYEKVDEEVVDLFREIAVLFGRAVSMSCVAAMAHYSVEDHAIANMDQAWSNLADKIVKFAEADLMSESVERLIQSREIAMDQVNAAIGRADDNFAAGSVTANSAIASAIVYLADVLLFGFTLQEPKAEEIS